MGFAPPAEEAPVKNLVNIFQDDTTSRLRRFTRSYFCSLLHCKKILWRRLVPQRREFLRRTKLVHSKLGSSRHPIRVNRASALAHRGGIRSSARLLPRGAHRNRAYSGLAARLGSCAQAGRTPPLASGVVRRALRTGRSSCANSIHAARLVAEASAAGAALHGGAGWNPAAVRAAPDPMHSAQRPGAFAAALWRRRGAAVRRPRPPGACRRRSPRQSRAG